MKKIIMLGCIAAALAGGVYFWSGSQDSRAQQEKQAVQQQPVGVTVYTVAPHEVVFTKDLPGRTSAFQVAEIRPQVTGIILKRLFTEGSLVKKGQQLYQIDPATYQAAYDSAAATLAKARADLKAVTPKVERYARLVKMGGVSLQAYDDAVAAQAQAKAGVAVARAQLAATKIDLDYTKVFSPISGRIGRSSVTEGALVTANQTVALATVQNLDQIYVDVNQSSDDIMALRSHMKDLDRSPEAGLFIGRAATPYPETGKVLFSDVTVDRGTGMVQLRILFPNPNDDLLPGLFVKARVEQFRQESAITVPQQAAIRNPDGSVSVWTVDDQDRVKTRQITVSRVVGDQWLVTGGLTPGDRVIVAGIQKISPNAKVTPSEMDSTKPITGTP
jgi:membrane fusion protein (multidrug efflux system)